MRKVRFFDSLAHPTLDGSWTMGRIGQTFDQLAQRMEEDSRYQGAALCGLEGVGCYDPERYFAAASKLPGRILPIAPYQFKYGTDQITELRRIGYKAIKIHLHSSIGTGFRSSDLRAVLERIYPSFQLVYICTYCYRINMRPNQLLSDVLEVAAKYADTATVFAHGGVHELMHYYEVLKHTKNTYLDLSYTTMRYGNIYDNVLSFLTENFNTRLLIGSDSPEYEYSEVIKKFHSVANESSDTKVDDIMFRNMKVIWDGIN